MTATADLLFQPVDAIVCASSGNATVRVLDEGPAKQFGRIVVIQVMDNAVAELCGENFPFFRVCDNETGRRQGLIAAFPQIIAKLIQALVQIPVETDNIVLALLVKARILVCLSQILHQYFAGK